MHRDQPDISNYARLFNSVEGNTSFYHLPEQRIIEQWGDNVPADFRFTFKLPRQISHQTDLSQDRDYVKLVLKRFAALEDKLGCLMLQLPASFGPTRLGELKQFFERLPSEFSYAVEVRHMGFFDKSQNEQNFNQLLNTFSINRVIMDTRALFACKHSRDDIVLDVQRKKPKVPTHVVATSQKPIIRFVGHPEMEENIPYLLPWIDKHKLWLEQGLQPFMFFHMPDNAHAPGLAQLFFEQFAMRYPQVVLPEFSLPRNDVSQLNMFND